MADAPAPPMQKLWDRYEQAIEFGKEFDEIKERRALGLPPPTNTPVFVEADPTRRRLTEREDRQGERELARMSEEAQRLQKEATDQSVANLAAENEQLRVELERMKAEQAAAGVVEAPPAGAEMDKYPGPPTMEWSSHAMKSWAASRNIKIPGGGIGWTKTQILEHVTGALSEVEPPTDGDGELVGIGDDDGQ